MKSPLIVHKLIVIDLDGLTFVRKRSIQNITVNQINK